jgi:polysaccharide chain length determinant protein (PEP-CTERM system associated)
MNRHSVDAYRRDLVEYLEVPLRHPWHIVIPTVLVVAASVTASLTLPKRYRTSTLILVESQKVPDSFVRKDLGEASKPRLLTIKQEILSRTRLEKVIRELDPYPQMTGKMPLTDIVEIMRGASEINVRGNDAFTVEYEHHDPAMAMRVANRLAGLFIEESNQSREEQVEGAAEFIESQLEDARRKLEEKEEAIRKFKEAHMGRLPEQTAANLATLQRLQLEQQSVSDNLRATRERELVLEKALNDERSVAVPVTPGDPAAELSQLRAQLRALRARYTDEHPDVQALQGRIAELEKRLEEASPITEAPTTIRSQLEQSRIESRTLQAKRDELEKRIAMFQGRVEEVPRTEQELAVLTRDYQKMNENYLALLNKKLDAQMAERLEKRWKGERFRILDPAYQPENPVFPRRSLFLSAGIVLGLLLGLVLAFVGEYFDHTIKSLGELEATLPYPVLAAFPHMDVTSLRRLSRRSPKRKSQPPPRASAGGRPA